MRIVSCGWPSYFPFGELTDSLISTRDIESGEFSPGDILVIWGGADISPALYNKGLSRFGYGSEKPSHRDAYEWDWLKRAIKADIPIVGVCRGAQMLCAAAGGHLIQDVNNHACRGHLSKTKDGDEILVNSIHHQMMYPFDVEHELIAWSENISEVYWDVNDQGEDIQIKMEKEPELVLFPKIKGVAVQWHPEGMNVRSPATQLVFNMIKEVV
jgi:putative glutamine amidotransferase